MDKNSFIKAMPESYNNEEFYEICRLATVLGIHGEKSLFGGGAGIYVAYKDSEYIYLKKSIICFHKKYKVGKNEFRENIQKYQLLTLEPTDGVYFEMNNRNLNVYEKLFNFAQIPEDVLKGLFAF